MDDVLKIALGVFIGALAAAFAWEGIQYVRVQVALELATQDAKRAAAKAREERRQREQAQQEADQRERQVQLERLEQARADAEVLRRAQLAREAAWQRFYKPSAPCRVDPSTTPCANEFMRARQLFDVQYDAGTLR